MSSFSERKDRIGPMCDLINVYREVEIKDSEGAVEINKSKIIENYFAKVVYDVGNEQLEDKAIQLFQSITVTCRYAGFAEKDIVEHNGRFYDVFSVESFERNAYQVLKCTLHAEADDVVIDDEELNPENDV